MHEIQLKTIWQIKQLKILPGMANGRVLKSQGKNGTLTSVMMGKLSLQSPALSKQALNFMLNKNALSADRKSILYLVKKNAWNLNPRVIHTSTPKIKINSFDMDDHYLSFFHFQWILSIVLKTLLIFTNTNISLTLDGRHSAECTSATWRTQTLWG